MKYRSTKTRGGGGLARLRDSYRCRTIIRRWARQQRRARRRQALARRLRRLPHYHQIGDALYRIGFWVEYAGLSALRAAGRLAGFLFRSLGLLAAAVLHPLRQLFASLADAFAAGVGLRALLGLAIPGAAAVGFALLVNTTLHREYILQVQVNGVPVGYVASEQVFESAREDVAARISNAQAVLGSDDAAYSDLAFQPTYTLATGGETMSEGEAADAILRTASDRICDATAVYIDGALRYVTADGDHLRTYLAKLLTPVLRDAGGAGDVSFVHNITLSDGVYLNDSVQDEGDVVAALAAEPDLLQVQVKTQQSYEHEIPFDTVVTESDAYDFGDEVTVQEGANGLERITEEITTVNGAVTNVETLSVEVLQPPVDAIVARGRKIKDSMRGNVNGVEFLWPVPAYREVSQWMNAGHTGTDIAAPQGTPIVAAAAGTVITAYSWNGVRTRGDMNSYGNYVEIDHGNGYRTRYGHMVSFVVSVGEYVEQGQIIGYVGNTGYSFGNHCHFEMFGPSGRFSARVAFPNIPVWNR